MTLIFSGNLDKLDPYVRRKMAQRLDIPTVANWRELARRLKLGTLERAFEIHTSPTIQVLAEYEVCSQLFDASDRLWTCRKYCFVAIMAGVSVVMKSARHTSVRS